MAGTIGGVIAIALGSFGIGAAAASGKKAPAIGGVVLFLVGLCWMVFEKSFP